MENKKGFSSQEGAPNPTQDAAQEQGDLRGKIRSLLRTAGLAAVLGTLTFSVETASAQQPQQEKQRIEHIRKEMGDERYYEALINGTQEREPALAQLLDGARMREVSTDPESKGQEKIWYIYLPSRDVVLTVQFKDFRNNPTRTTGTALEDGLKEFDANFLIALYRANLIEIYTSEDGRDYIIPTIRNLAHQ